MYLSNQVFLAAEDRLGLALGHRLIGEHPSLQVWRELNAGGFGILKRDVDKFNNMAHSGYSVLMLTDQDGRQCCGELFDEWLGKGKKTNLNFLLRICKHEAEAWLLAHPAPLAKLFKISESSFPTNPESFRDPKAELLRLAAHAPSKIRKSILPAAGSMATIGIEYNEILCPLVIKEWDINAASAQAPSLARARMRVRELASRITPG